MKSVSNDEWAELAGRLPIGQKRRTFHSCSTSFKKTNFEYGRDRDGVWCKCYRCGYARHHDMNHAPYQVQEPVQVRVPNDVRPLVELIAKHPQALLPVLEREHLTQHISILTASEKYGRVYLPDDTASFCGLDFTGRQFIPWRSPHKHNLAMTVRPTSDADTENFMWVYGTASDYLDHIRSGIKSGGAAFVATADKTTLGALVSVLLAYRYTAIGLHHPDSNLLRKELSVCGRVFTTGE